MGVVEINIYILPMYKEPFFLLGDSNFVSLHTYTRIALVASTDPSLNLRKDVLPPAQETDMGSSWSNNRLRNHCNKRSRHRLRSGDIPQAPQMKNAKEVMSEDGSGVQGMSLWKKRRTSSFGAEA